MPAASLPRSDGHAPALPADGHAPAPYPPTGTVRLSVSVPGGKGPGDTLTFTNPANPAQKLRVAIPPGFDGSRISVNVPGPGGTAAGAGALATAKARKMTFSNETREALDTFSRTYDDWVDAEARHQDLAAEGGVGFKVKVKKMDKFDEPVASEFPKDLATPVDASFLRLLVRRTRQNRQKRKNRDEPETLGDGLLL